MIGSCPECKEAIRIPEGSLKQVVRCPLCSAEYELEQVFEQLPPMLELVGSSSEGIGIQIESAGELELSNAESAESSGATPRYQPQRRRQTNAFAEILKVVLGGVLALPIGVLCVWWFAGRAPFGFAEQVSEYMPWIVPEKLRGGDKVDDSDLEDLDDRSDKQKQKDAIDSFRKNANRKMNKQPQSKGVLGITKSVEKDSDANQKQTVKKPKGQGSPLKPDQDKATESKDDPQIPIEKADGKSAPNKAAPSKAAPSKTDKQNQDPPDSNSNAGSNSNAAKEDEQNSSTAKDS